jgi:hypothetical protein
MQVDIAQTPCVISVIRQPVIASNVQQSAEAITSALRQVLEIRHPGVLVLYGLSSDWQQVQLACDTVNSEVEDNLKNTESAISDPVLVLGMAKQVAWLGSRTPYTSVLNRLLETENGEASLAQLELLVDDTNRWQSVLKHIRSGTRLSIMRGDRLALRVTMAAIAKAVGDTLISYLQRDDEPIGVLTSRSVGADALVTPALHKVDRWVRMGPVLENSCSTSLAMLALSYLLKRHSCWADHEEIWGRCLILSDLTVHLESVEELRRQIPVVEEPVLIPLSSAMPPEYRKRLKQGTPVLVHLDILLSDESMHHCVKKARRDGAVPVAVTCVLDARKQKKQEIKIWGDKIPIICLAQPDFKTNDLQEASQVKLINPVTKVIEQDLVELRYPIEEVDLDNLLEERGALYLSHITRPPGRHFTFYYDANKMLGVNDGRLDRIIYIVNDWVSQAARSSDGRGTISPIPIEIWYPEEISPQGPLPNPAETFARWISGRRGDIDHILGINREPIYSERHFANTEIEPVTYPNVLIVDWGAVVGSTITQMLRRAARAQAQSALVCVLSSQLPQDQEAFLRSINRIEVGKGDVKEFPASALGTDLTDSQGDISEYEASVGPGPWVTNTKLAFISALPVKAYSEAECPICRQRGRISGEEEVYPTQLLRETGERYKKILRARKLEEVLLQVGGPVSLDDQVFTTRAIVWMFRFRDKLLTSQSSTRMRQHVVDKLDEICKEVELNPQSPPDEAKWLMHLLTAEGQWLRKPPLNLHEVRTMVADLAYKVARVTTSEADPVLRARDDALRANAIIVLRTSSKEVFAKRFAELFDTCRDSTDDILIKQLLYDGFTYLEGPHQPTPQELEKLVGALRIVADKINKPTTGWLLSQSIDETVSSLYRRADLRSLTAEAAAQGPLNAWRGLQTAYRQMRLDTANLSDPKAGHSEVQEAIGQLSLTADRNEPEMLRFLSNPEQPPPQFLVEFAHGLAKRWEICESFLRKKMLPYLAQLIEILQAEEAREISYLDYGDTVRIASLCNSKNPPAEWTFSKLINAIATDLNVLRDESIWRTYEDEHRWFYDCLLQLGAEGVREARLLQLLSSAPVKLKKAVSEAYADLQYRQLKGFILSGVESLDDIEVFCTEHVLRNVVGEIFENASKHWRTEDREASRFPEIRVKSERHNDKGVVLLRVQNNRTKRHEEPGVGLFRVAHSLRPFEGNLKEIPKPEEQDDDWSTFVVELNLLAF